MAEKESILGRRFGRLVVKGEAGRDSRGNKTYRCACDCGSETLVTKGNLTSGKTSSCGCLMKENASERMKARHSDGAVDRTGERHGSLTVLGYVGSDGINRPLAICECDCGRKVLRSNEVLKASVDTTRCGKFHGQPMRDGFPNLAGMRFGRLLAVKEARLRGYIAYKCLCDCGRKVTVRASDLLSGAKTQCAPFDHSLIGRRFGRLTVKGYARSDNGKGAIMLCRCKCGKSCEVQAHQLKNGCARSCGCGEAENRARNMRDHSKRIHVDGTNLAALATGKLRPDNTSGVRGVMPTKSGKWRAYITFQGATRRLGTFEKLEDAAEARRNAERELFGPVLEDHGIAPPD